MLTVPKILTIIYLHLIIESAKRGGKVLTNRQKLILKAIVEEYVKTNEPVGSKVLTQKPYLDFSSATIRYDMQFLEENGYLEKTHTSSGRVPSEQGYKFYVENLVTRDEETAEVFPYVDSILQTDKEVSEKIKEVVDLISTYTGYMVATLGTSANYQTVKKMEIVPLSENECVLLIVTSGGKVQSQNITIPRGYKMDDLLRLIEAFDNAMYDRSVIEITDVLSKEAKKPRIRQMVDFQDDLLNFLIKAFARFSETDFYQSGLSKIFNQPEFNDHESMSRIIQMVDDETVKVALKNCGSGLTVHIGSDNFDENLKDCSIVTMPYTIDMSEFGIICIIGPIRMNYSKVFPLIEYAASGIGKLYKKE